MIFELFLAILFGYFAERLISSSYDDKAKFILRSILYICTVALILFVQDRMEIASVYYIRIIIGFLIVNLIDTHVGAWILLPFKKMDRKMQDQFQNPSRFEVNIGRFSLLMASFSKGIANAKSRKSETFLTCLTLVILAFTVISFSSIESILVTDERSVGETPSEFEGLLLNAHWLDVEATELYEETLYNAGVSDSMAMRSVYSPFPGTRRERTLEIEVLSGKFHLGHILGLTPEEDGVTNLSEFLLFGRWLNPGERNVLIISDDVAKEYGIYNEDDLGSAIFMETRYDIIGVIDSTAIDTTFDVNGEPFLAVGRMYFDFYKDLGDDYDDAPERHGFAIAAYDDVIDFGGFILSAAIPVTNPYSRIEEFEFRIPHTFWSMSTEGMDEIVVTLRTIVEGFHNIPVMMIIATLILFNVLLSAVYQRQTDIHVYSCVGLSPSHVAAIFMSQAFVYTTVAAVTGYIGSGLLSKVLLRYDLASEFVYNFTSFDIYRSVVLLFVVGIAASYYPAYVASRMSLPGLERTWKTTEVVGEEVTKTLPFKYSKEHAKGFLSFLIEGVKGTSGSGASPLGTVSEVSHFTETIESKPHYGLQLNVHLEPFDAGINALIKITMLPSEDDEQIYHLSIYLKRLTGDMGSWNRGIDPFLSKLRKNCLIWRDIPQEKREEFVKEAPFEDN